MRNYVKSWKPVETSRVTLFNIADGKVREIWVYDNDQETIDEFFSWISLTLNVAL